MKRYYYKFMARGFNVVSEGDSEVKREIVYYSKTKYVMARNEEVARIDIHNKLTNHKWTGFRLLTDNKKINETTYIGLLTIDKNRTFLTTCSMKSLKLFYLRKVDFLAAFLKRNGLLNELQS